MSDGRSDMGDKSDELAKKEGVLSPLCAQVGLSGEFFGGVSRF